MCQIRFRPFVEADILPLRHVYESAVSELTAREYTQEQRTAWIQASQAPECWRATLERIQPTVVIIDDVVSAYFDLQPDGLIDQFYVAAPFAHQGIARLMMAKILHRARQQHLPEVYAYVSLTAQLFFVRNGFEVVFTQKVELGGQVLENARMRKVLLPE